MLTHPPNEIEGFVERQHHDGGGERQKYEAQQRQACGLSEELVQVTCQLPTNTLRQKVLKDECLGTFPNVL